MTINSLDVTETGIHGQRVDPPDTRSPQSIPGEARSSAAAPIAALISRVPFTTVVTALMLSVGVLTGTLWNAAAARGRFAQIAYGLPSLAECLWWTPITGAFFAVTPMIYL